MSSIPDLFMFFWVPMMWLRLWIRMVQGIGPYGLLWMVVGCDLVSLILHLWSWKVLGILRLNIISWYVCYIPVILCDCIYICIQYNINIHDISISIYNMTICNTTRHNISIKVNGYKSKYNQGPGPFSTIHTPRSMPWSIPHRAMRSIPDDPYPQSSMIKKNYL